MLKTNSKGVWLQRAEGLSLKLGIQQTWAVLFQQNEEIYWDSLENPEDPRLPLEDWEISLFMKKEFPSRYGNKIFEKVTQARDSYNYGRFGFQNRIPAQYLSYRYKTNGHPVLKRYQKETGWQKINPRWERYMGAVTLGRKKLYNPVLVPAAKAKFVAALKRMKDERRKRKVIDVFKFMPHLSPENYKPNKPQEKPR